jgi:hypothetical protein
MQVQWRKSRSKIARKGCPFKILNSWFQEKEIILMCILTALVTLQSSPSSRTRNRKKGSSTMFFLQM